MSAPEPTTSGASAGGSPSAPVPDTASEAQAAEPRPGQAKVVTTTSGLRLRRLPGTDGAVIKEMPIGAVVDVLQVVGLWANVRYVDGRGMAHAGWCCVGQNGIDYLKFG